MFFFYTVTHLEKSIDFMLYYVMIDLSMYYFYLFFYIYYDFFFLYSYLHIELFTLLVSNNAHILFKPLQEHISLLNADVALIFFRLYNASNYAYTFLTTYTVFPFFYSIFITKIQCFCFDTILIKKYSSVDLPVLFTITLPLHLVTKNTVKLSLIYSLFII